MYTFLLFNPEIKQDKRGGGFIFSAEVPESEWENIRDVNNPDNMNKAFMLRLFLLSDTYEDNKNDEEKKQTVE